jgi:hypothetical protein
MMAPPPTESPLPEVRIRCARPDMETGPAVHPRSAPFGRGLLQALSPAAWHKGYWFTLYCVTRCCNDWVARDEVRIQIFILMSEKKADLGLIQCCPTRGSALMMSDHHAPAADRPRKRRDLYGLDGTGHRLKVV